MAYNDLIDRNGASSLIPEELSQELFQSVAEESAVLRFSRRLPDMGAKTLKLPVLNSLPLAHFVDGDTGLKKTSKADWTNKIITAEEIAVIIPVPDAVLEDAGFDIWAQIQPLVTQAFGQVIDRAILYGDGKPASWPGGIVAGATAANQVKTKTAALYDDIMAPGGLISMVEDSGYLVGGYIGATGLRGLLRGVKDTAGQPIFRSGMAEKSAYTLDGESILFPRNGAVDPTKSLLIGGDFTQLVYAIRQDLTATLLTQSVITDETGKIVYNLAQQDMSALRFVMRLGWQLPNPVNPVGGAQRYPFAVLKG